MNARLNPAQLKPRALYEDVAELLRQRIFQRDLKPGEWIDELKLAAEFGISRTPMREAIKVLAAEGLVTMKVRRGAYVSEASEQDLRDVFAMLSLLEGEAAAVVAGRATTTELAELRTLHTELSRATRNHEKFFSLNEAFHHALLRIAANRWLAQTVADLRKVMKLHRHHSLFKQGRIAESLAEHAAILEAIESGNAELARARSKQHFENGLIAAG